MAAELNRVSMLQADTPEWRLWAAIAELASYLTADQWVLIGGQMVALHNHCDRVPLELQRILRRPTRSLLVGHGLPPLRSVRPTGGCSHLIICDNTRTPAEVLATYRDQPNLERRNHMLKGPQQVAPVYMQTPHRIEAQLLCQFLALLTQALIEREIRTTMKTAELTTIPLYPELRSCPAPSAPRILEIFNSITQTSWNSDIGRCSRC